MPSSHRLARLLEMLTLFQGGLHWGPRDIAARFGISETRVYDDIRELNRAGIPVAYNSTGYRLPPDAFLPALNLTPRDVLDLLYPQALLNGADPERLKALQAKVLAALPAGLRAKFGEVVESTNVAVGSSPQRDQTFALVHQAIAEKQRLEIVYYDYSANETSRRQLEPYGLVYRRHAWYCVGRCLRHNQTRKFRLSRIRQIALTPFTFQPPADFSLDGYMAGSWEVYSGELVEVVIRFSPRIAPLIADHPQRPGQTIQHFSDGSILYRVTVKGTDEIAWWVVQYGAEAEVLRPRELCDKLLNMASKIVRLYAGQPESTAQQIPLVAEPPEPYRTRPPEPGRPGARP